MGLRKTLFAILVAALMAPALLAQSEGQKPKPPKASRKLVSSIELYTKKQDSAGAVKGIREVLVKEPRNFHANAWLGYILMLDGQYAEAVVPLATAHSIDPSDQDVLTNLAYCADKGGDRDAAYKAYQDLNAAKPNDAVVLNKLGVMAFERNDFTSAVNYFELADKAAPGDKGTTTNLAAAYLRVGNTAKAKEAYQRLVDMNPDAESMVHALSWLGFNAIQDGDYEAAAGYLERARSLRGNDLEVLNNLGNAYLNMKPPKEAEAVDTYQQMVALDPNLYEPWYNLGVLYLRQGKVDASVDANEKALARKADEPFALNNLGRGYELQGRFAMAGDTYAKASNASPGNAVFAHNAAVAYTKAKMESKAVPFIERARKLGDTDIDMTMVLSASYFKAGKEQEAIDMLSGAADKVQNRADLWFNLAVLHERVGHKKQAEECYRKSLEIKPDDIDANTNLALLLLARDDWQAATPYMEKVAGMNPASVDAKLNLAAAYYRANRVDDAVALWKSVLEIAPNRTDVRLNLANTMWSAGDYQGAFAHFQVAVKEQPKNAQALNGVGLWYLRESKTTEAANAFRSAVKADSKYMPSYNNLAVALERLNKRKEAITVLEQALKVDPSFTDAKKNLQRLKASEK